MFEHRRTGRLALSKTNPECSLKVETPFSECSLRRSRVSIGGGSPGRIGSSEDASP